MSRLPRDPVYLVDASIYIFQAWVSPHYLVSSTAGDDLSAFFGFAQFLQRFLRQTRPRQVAVTFDESLFCGFRHSLYSAYKSNRELPDAQLARQLEACAALAPLMGVPAWGSRVYEADDIIGTLARRVAPQPVCIVSRDKDLAQLLRRDDDHLWDYTANTRRFRADIERQYGIRAEQIPDYLGLVGDPVDAIPGVPGIGPVAARALLQHFGTLEQLYANLEDVALLRYRGADRTAQLLQAHEHSARMSRQLATIIDSVDDPTEAFSRTESDGLRWRNPDIEGIARLLASLDLEPLAQERFLTLMQGLQPVTEGAV
jgi:DNA polymerase-1